MPRAGRLDRSPFALGNMRIVAGDEESVEAKLNPVEPSEKEVVVNQTLQGWPGHSVDGIVCMEKCDGMKKCRVVGRQKQLPRYQYSPAVCKALRSGEVACDMCRLGRASGGGLFPA